MRPACVIEKDQGATIGNGVTVEPLCRSQVMSENTFVTGFFSGDGSWTNAIGTVPI